jgi:hypothetical protein
MPNKQAKRDVNEAARLLGKRSAAARKKQLGSQAFESYMRELGKLGGRPSKKTDADASEPTTKRKGRKG